MKKTLIFLAVFAMLNTAWAQLPTGSIAPNFKLKEIDKSTGKLSNDIELYKWLDEEKPVMLYFSTVWCGYCWVYHQTNSMKNAYNLYGPSGTDELKIIYIESETGTYAQLSGGIGSQGNWINGTPYTIIPTGISPNTGKVVSDYGVPGYPTIFMACPSRYLINVPFDPGPAYGGSKLHPTAADILAYANKCPSFPDVTNNASIFKGIEKLKTMNKCAITTPIKPEITIQNTGSDVLTSAKIKIELNDSTTYANWTGNLNKWGTDVFALPELKIPDGTHNYTVTIEEANGVPVTPTQNKASKTFYQTNVPLISELNEGFSQNFPPTWWEDTREYLGVYKWTGNNYAVYFLSWGNQYLSNGDYTELILPLLNFSSNPAPCIQFDRANAPYTGFTNNNRLEVYVSTNCGANWTRVYYKTGADLNTAPSTTNQFAPKAAADWRTEVVELPALANKENVLIKFKFTCGQGNFMWLDNVKTSNNCQSSINEYSGNASVQLYPNPVTDELYIQSDKPVQSVQIYNIQGQVVISESENTHSVSMSRLSNGLYIVKTIVNDEVHITKIVKQ